MASWDVVFPDDSSDLEFEGEVAIPVAAATAAVAPATAAASAANSWDDELQQLLAEPEAQVRPGAAGGCFALAPAAVDPQQPRRGRPKGTFGGRELRNTIRDLQAIDASTHAAHNAAARDVVAVRSARHDAAVPGAPHINPLVSISSLLGLGSSLQHEVRLSRQGHNYLSERSRSLSYERNNYH